MADPKLPKAYSQYGASVGRSTTHEASPSAPIKLRLWRVHLDTGGYDNGGAYWGIGLPLYAVDGEGVRFYLRAEDREQAKESSRTKYPHATFYR